MIKLRKPKVEPVWEQQDLLDAAKARLVEMENDPENFKLTSKEEDLISYLEFVRGRLQSMDPKSEEAKSLKVQIDSIKIELDALKTKNPLDAQREYVQSLIDKKLEWQKEFREKPMTKEGKWYIRLTAIGLAMPIIGEQLGKLWRHIDTRVTLPWKKLK